jgi:hypothetical protein
VHGAAARLHVDRTTLEQEHVGTSIHIELLVRGAARASITGITSGGKPVTIAWDGGTPIDLRGPGARFVTPLALDADAGGVLVHLDGVVLQLDPGDWHLTGPVAVGRGGLAAPADRADFTAGPAARASFHGGAGLRLPPATRALEGPGAVTIDGTFTVRTAHTTATRAHVQAPATPYHLTLTWTLRGLTVDGTIAGSVT